MNIFANDKNQELRELIEASNGNSYKAVEQWLSTHHKWFNGYLNYRTSQGLPKQSKNKTIWELINMLDDDSTEFEA